MNRFIIYEDFLLYGTVIVLAIIAEFAISFIKKRQPAEAEFERSYVEGERIAYLSIAGLILLMLILLFFNLMDADYILLIIIGLFALYQFFKLFFEFNYHRETKRYLKNAVWLLFFILTIGLYANFLFAETPMSNVLERHKFFEEDRVYKISVDVFEGGESKQYVTRDEEEIRQIIKDVSNTKVNKRLIQPKETSPSSAFVVLNVYGGGIAFDMGSNYFNITSNRVYYKVDHVDLEDIFQLNNLKTE